MYITQGFKGFHKWYHYLMGTAIIFFLFLIGQGGFGLLLVLSARDNMSKIVAGKNPISGMIDASGWSPNMVTFLMLFSFIFGFFGVIWTVKYLHKRSFKSLLTTRSQFDWKRFFLSFGLMGIFIVISVGVSYYTHPEELQLQFALKPFLLLVLIAVVLVPFQAGFEELFFRGYLMQGLGVVFKNRWTPLVVTSVVFGLMHGSNPEVTEYGSSLLLYYIGTGLFLGIITLMDEGMELALGFHIANNMIQIILVTSDYSVFQSPSLFKDISEPGSAWQEMIFPLLILYPMLILIFAKKYYWHDWKNRLIGKVKSPEPDLKSLSRESANNPN